MATHASTMSSAASSLLSSSSSSPSSCSSPSMPPLESSSTTTLGHRRLLSRATSAPDPHAHGSQDAITAAAAAAEAAAAAATAAAIRLHEQQQRAAILALILPTVLATYHPLTLDSLKALSIPPADTTTTTTTHAIAQPSSQSPYCTVCAQRAQPRTTTTARSCPSSPSMHDATAPLLFHPHANNDANRDAADDDDTMTDESSLDTLATLALLYDFAQRSTAYEWQQQHNHQQQPPHTTFAPVITSPALAHSNGHAYSTSSTIHSTVSSLHTRASADLTACLHTSAPTSSRSTDASFPTEMLTTLSSFLAGLQASESLAALPAQRFLDVTNTCNTPSSSNVSPHAVAGHAFAALASSAAAAGSVFPSSTSPLATASLSSSFVPPSLSTLSSARSPCSSCSSCASHSSHSSRSLSSRSLSSASNDATSVVHSACATPHAVAEDDAMLLKCLSQLRLQPAQMALPSPPGSSSISPTLASFLQRYAPAAWAQLVATQALYNSSSPHGATAMPALPVALAVPAMRCIRQVAFGEPSSALVWTSAPIPTPVDGQVVIRVHATSVNPIDVKIVRGVTQAGFMQRSLPCTPGFDLSGVVTAVGANVTRLRVGDMVYADSTMTNGAFADFVAIDESLVSLMPRNLSFCEAACVPLAGLTSLCALEKANLQRGDSILILGGSGGTGSFAIQLAALIGARHIVVTCSAKNADYCTSLGAHEAYDYAHPTRSIVEQAAGQRFDVVFDCVADATTVQHVVPHLLHPKTGRYLTLVGDVDRVASSVTRLPVTDCWMLGRPLPPVGVAGHDAFLINGVHANCRTLDYLTALIESGHLVVTPLVEWVFEWSYDGVLQLLAHSERGHTRGKAAMQMCRV